MAATAKFMFDNDFTPGRVEAAPKVDLAAHEAEVAAAEQRGYRAGMNAAEAQARTEAERRIALAMEHIGASLDRLASSLSSVEQKLEIEAVEVAARDRRQPRVGHPTEDLVAVEELVAVDEAADHPPFAPKPARRPLRDRARRGVVRMGGHDCRPLRPRLGHRLGEAPVERHVRAQPDGDRVPGGVGVGIVGIETLSTPEVGALGDALGAVGSSSVMVWQPARTRAAAAKP